ncbi:MAG: hypothetical protein AAFW46_04560 [Pseudomonadota bacterium]
MTDLLAALPDLTVGAAVLCAAVVALGAVIHTVTGQAFGMIVAPLMTLAAPDPGRARAPES